MSGDTSGRILDMGPGPAESADGAVIELPKERKGRTTKRSKQAAVGFDEGSYSMSKEVKRLKTWF